jgi:hypothetical protein
VILNFLSPAKSFTPFSSSFVNNSMKIFAVALLAVLRGSVCRSFDGNGNNRKKCFEKGGDESELN